MNPLRDQVAHAIANAGRCAHPGADRCAHWWQADAALAAVREWLDDVLAQVTALRAENDRLQAERDSALVRAAEAKQLAYELGETAAERNTARADLASLAYWYCANCERRIPAADVVRDENGDAFCPYSTDPLEWAEPETLTSVKALRDRMKQARDEAWADRDEARMRLGVAEEEGRRGWACYNDQLDATRQLDDLRMREIGDLTRERDEALRQRDMANALRHQATARASAAVEVVEAAVPYVLCPHADLPRYDPNPTLVGRATPKTEYADYAQHLDTWHPGWWDDDIDRMAGGLRAEAQARRAPATTMDGGSDA